MTTQCAIAQRARALTRTMRQRHSEYSTADECGRNERSIESCSSNSSSRSECNIVSFNRDDNIECRWPLCVNVWLGFRDDDRAKL